MDQAVTEISRALAPLREVASSLQKAALGQTPRGQERRRLVRRARMAGAAVLPALLRSLSAADEGEAEWAAYLLRRVGGDRVVSKLHGMLRDPEVSDDAKGRALGVLADMKAPQPSQVVLRNPELMLVNSVQDLLCGLGSRAELGQAVDLILEQVPQAEIPSFVREVLDHGGDAAAPLIKALMADPRTPRDLAQDLGLLLPRTGFRSDRAGPALEQALDLLQEGKAARARKQLELLAAAHPTDPEVRSALGVCLLELGQAEPAIGHLEQAARLQPESALHLWNLAAAARAADQMGICYKMLQAYQEKVDLDVGAMERQREARVFCQAYEGMLQEAYPGVPLGQVLRGEEVFASGYAALSESRYDEAMVRFREVLNLVPRHYPSWGNLGATYLALSRTQEALHCLQRALELNPNYTIARENLALIEGR